MPKTDDEWRVVGWMAVIIALVIGMSFTASLYQSSWAVVQRLAGQ